MTPPLVASGLRCWISSAGTFTLLQPDSGRVADLVTDTMRSAVSGHARIGLVRSTWRGKCHHPVFGRVRLRGGT